MTTSTLLVVGNGATARMAMSVAAVTRPDCDVRLVELATNDIATLDVGSLGLPPGQAMVFAAIGPSALGFARFDLWAKLKFAGYRFATLTHPAASCDPTVTLGENVLIGAGTIIADGASVGRGTVVGAGSVIAADTSIAPWCWLATGVMLGTGCSVGSHTVFGVGSRVADGAVIGATCELDSRDVLRGTYASGTFITPEFPVGGARFIAHPSAR